MGCQDALLGATVARVLYRGDKLLLSRFKAYFTGEMNV